MIRHKCHKCGKIWYCKGEHCNPKNAPYNCACDKCSKCENKDCREIKGVKDWRIA